MSARGTARGRGRGRGRAAPAGDDGPPAPKRSKTLKPRDCVFLLIDTGKSTSTLRADGITALEHGKRIADWILSRKIFADSDVVVNVGFFPPLPTQEADDIIDQTVQFIESRFVVPRIAHVKRILDVVPSDADGNFLSALKKACDHAAQSDTGGSQFFNAISFAVISNFAGPQAKLNSKEVADVVQKLEDLKGCVNFIGYDKSDENLGIKQETVHVVDTILSSLDQSDDANGMAVSFENAFTALSYFGQKPKQLRGAPFKLELGEHLAIEVSMYSKVTRERFTLKTEKVTDDNEVVKVIREFQKTQEETKTEPLDAPVDEDNRQNGSEGPSNEAGVDKDQVIRGYHYGSSIIPFTKADKEFATVKNEGKQLQLVQFTKKHNILPYFIMSECRYLVPNLSKQNKSDQYLASLVQTMLDRDVVAIARYAYNIVAQPRLVVMIPEISKKSKCPILQLFQLPFNEDLRMFEFPDLKDVGQEPDDLQLDAIDAYIDHFMLETPSGDSLYDPEQVRNPIQQKTCMSVKRKALGMPLELSEEEKAAILAPLSTPANVAADSETVLNTLTEFFNLVKTEDVVGYDGKSQFDLKGVKTSWDWED
uniref:Ku domain-containing protein n=1 Tax=Panagrellus redivivus TaxID=6233 RepID=A0A7E4ZTA3_PANRE